MRPPLLLLLAALALLIAGCASAPVNVASNAGGGADAANAPAPWHSQGKVWLPPTKNNSRGALAFNFTVNATSGATVTAVVKIGETWVVDLPQSIANVDAKLVDASGKELAKAARGVGGAMELKLEGKGATPGPGQLVLSYDGGSDQGQGGGFGESVTLTIDVR